MSNDVFTVQLASVERWADEIMGLATSLSAAGNGLVQIEESELMVGLDSQLVEQIVAIRHVLHDSQRIASDLLLDFAASGILPADPPGFDDLTPEASSDVSTLDGDTAAAETKQSQRRHVSAEQIEHMVSVLSLTDAA